MHNVVRVEKEQYNPNTPKNPKIKSYALQSMHSIKFATTRVGVQNESRPNTDVSYLAFVNVKFTFYMTALNFNGVFAGTPRNLTYPNPN